MSPKPSLSLGYSAAELAESPYARFFRPQMAPLGEAVREAVAIGGQAPELFPGFERAGALIAEQGGAVATGYTICPDGEVRVFDQTRMPGVTPAMWDWWFAWHGSEAQRYKLWHPRAHVDVKWADGQGSLGTYVGRTSHVVEYIGAKKIAGAIRFVRPEAIGIDETPLARHGAIAICARIGAASPAVDAGWLVHHVYPTADGSEMRSYFWMGGRHIAARGGNPVVSSLLRVATKIFPALAEISPTDLLVHCAQEMGHLAALLPDIHAEFGPEGSAGQ